MVRLVGTRVSRLAKRPTHAWRSSSKGSGIPEPLRSRLTMGSGCRSGMLQAVDRPAPGVQGRTTPRGVPSSAGSRPGGSPQRAPPGLCVHRHGCRQVAPAVAPGWDRTLHEDEHRWAQGALGLPTRAAPHRALAHWLSAADLFPQQPEPNLEPAGAGRGRPVTSSSTVAPGGKLAVTDDVAQKGAAGSVIMNEPRIGAAIGARRRRHTARQYSVPRLVLPGGGPTRATPGHGQDGYGQ